MKNKVTYNTRLLPLFLALCGMTCGLFFPANTLRRISADENKIPSVKPESIMPSAEQINQQLSKMPVAFEANRGQFDSQVRYMARAAGSTVFLTATEAVYVLPMASPKSEVQSPKSEDFRANDEVQTPTKMFALRMKLVGANADSTFAGEQIQEHRTNYFKGADAASWQTDVPNFGRVRYENVYQGVSMVWHGRENGATQYDFVVEPHADAGQINLEFDGADNLEIDADGNLLIHTPAGIIKHHKPVSYQETGSIRQEVESGFVIEQSQIPNLKSQIKFALGDYDRSKTLTIDPTVNLSNLAFSTFIGGGFGDFAYAVTVDATGNVYLTGQTGSPEFPTTAGVYDATLNSFIDTFVTKLNAAGSGLIYSTFIGGGSTDEGYGIAVDAAGNVFIAGDTVDAAIDYPITGGAYDTTHNGNRDVAVTKFNATGSSLLYSTFIGGSGSETGYDIAVDNAGNAFITGETDDDVTDYPTTGGAFDTTHNRAYDVFVTKLNAAGSSLLYSTFIGGSGFERGRDIAIDVAGNVFITGTTFDEVTDYPTTGGAFDTTHNGNGDVFVTKLNAAGSGLVYSTFIGGGDNERGEGIAVDSIGNAFITGDTIDNATDYPITDGAFDTTHNGSVDVFVTKLNPTGSSLIYSTFLGGDSSEFGNDVAVDNTGSAYITGGTGDSAVDYPTTATAFDPTHNGGFDAFMTKLNAAGSSLIYSTFIGGSGGDNGSGIAVDVAGNVYIAGSASDAATNFPTTNEAFQPFNAGRSDIFVSKFGDYAIAGRVIDPTGAPLANVMIAMSGQISNSLLTGADGRFLFLDTVPFAAHTVTATRSGYSINPALFNIASLNNNRELVFVGTVGSPTGGGGGTLRFVNLSYSRGENGASVTATVERTGNITTAEPVTVDFQTVNGTALAGADYVGQSGVLTFAHQFDNSKTITIPLLDDNQLEPRENFRIVLSNATNNADVDPNRALSSIHILDEDLAAGDLLISEFRLRGRLGANDEYVKLFNPNAFDVTVFAADESDGLTLARASGAADVTSILTIPNFVSIPAHGHYLLTNNNPSGGFSLIDYPIGIGTTTAVGDQTFADNIPDNSNLVLLKTTDGRRFNLTNLLDAVGFGNPAWTSEGGALAAISAENSETCFVRKLTADGLQDTNNNLADFLLVDNHARVFAGNNLTKIYSALGSPAPETTESLRLMTADEIGWTEFQTAVGTERMDDTPVPNGINGTLTLYRRITNNTGEPLVRLRLRVIDFPTAGSASQRRFSSRPDFRLLSSIDESEIIKGVTLAAGRLQPNGGGINSTLTVGAVTENTPLAAGESVVVAIRLGVMRYGRHPFSVAVEAMR